MERFRRIYLIKGHLRVTEDNSQHVVKIMRYSPRQPAYRFHLLCLLILGFESGRLRLNLFALCDVFNGSHGSQGLTCNIADDSHIHVDPYYRIVFANVALLQSVMWRLPTYDIMKSFQIPFSIFRVCDFWDSLRQQFISSVAGNFAQLSVHSHPLTSNWVGLSHAD